MNAHLAEIARAVAPGAYAVRVLDGAGWHAGKDLMVSDNITLIILPPYAPELNPVENVWQYLRANKLAITVFDGDADIVDKCCTAWNFFANDTAAIATITTRQWAQVNLQGRWLKDHAAQSHLSKKARGRVQIMARPRNFLTLSANLNPSL